MGLVCGAGCNDASMCVKGLLGRSPFCVMGRCAWPWDGHMWSRRCSATRQRGLQNRRGWPGWFSGRWKGAVAEPALAAEDEADGVVRAWTREPGRGVTICSGLVRAVHALAVRIGVIAVVSVR